MAEPASARPSRGRSYVLLLISVMYLITYLDRVNISLGGARGSTRSSASTRSPWASSSVPSSGAYALFQVPGGWLS